MPELLALVHEALQEGTPEAFKKVEASLLLLKDGTPPAEGLTPVLFAAIKAENIELVNMLLREGADPLLPDAKGTRPLHAATFTGNLDLLKLLVDARANPDASDRHGQTAMFFAPARDTCALLAEAKASIHHRNSKGQSAMHLAAHSGLEDSVLWFVQHMSPGTVNAQDKHGRTALWCGQRAGHKSVVALLESHGASKRIQPHKVWKEHPFGTTRLFPSQKRRVVPLAKGGDATIEALWCNEEHPAMRTDTPTMRKLRDLEAQARAWTQDRLVSDCCESSAQTNSKSVAPPDDCADGCHLWEVLLERTHDAQSFGFACRNSKVSYSHALGVEHHEGPEMLVIARVGRGSLLDHWNQAHPTQKVVRGNRILRVNGASTIRTMQEQLASKTVQLQVVRYLDRFQVVLPHLPTASRADFARSIRFGLRVTSTSGDLLIVGVVRGSLLEDFNRDMAAKGLYHLVVCPGMRIEAVNEVEGNNKYMEAELQAAETLQLRLRRAEEVLASELEFGQGSVSTNSTRPRTRPRGSQTVELASLLQVAPVGVHTKTSEHAAAVEGVPVYHSQSSAGMAMDHSFSSAVPTEAVAGELLDLIRESSRRWKQQQRNEDEEQFQQQDELESDIGLPEPDGASSALSSLVPEPPGQRIQPSTSAEVAGDYVPEQLPTEPSCRTATTVNDHRTPESAPVPRAEEAPLIELGGTAASASNPIAEPSARSGESSGMTIAASDATLELVQPTEQDGMGVVVSDPTPELVQPTEPHLIDAVESDPHPELVRPGESELVGPAVAIHEATPELTQPIEVDQDQQMELDGAIPELTSPTGRDQAQLMRPEFMTQRSNDPTPEVSRSVMPDQAQPIVLAMAPNDPPELDQPTGIGDATAVVTDPAPELVRPSERDQVRPHERNDRDIAANNPTPEVAQPAEPRRAPLAESTAMLAMESNPSPERARQTEPPGTTIVATDRAPEMAQLIEVDQGPPTEPHGPTSMVNGLSPELIEPDQAQVTGQDDTPELAQLAESDQAPSTELDGTYGVEGNPTPEMAQPIPPHQGPPSGPDGMIAVPNDPTPERAHPTEPHAAFAVASDPSPELAEPIIALASDPAQEQAQQNQQDGATAMERDPTPELTRPTQTDQPQPTRTDGMNDPTPELAPSVEPAQVPLVGPDGTTLGANSPTPEVSQPGEPDGATAVPGELAELTAPEQSGPTELHGRSAVARNSIPELTQPNERAQGRRVGPEGRTVMARDSLPELALPAEADRARLIESRGMNTEGNNDVPELAEAMGLGGMGAVIGDHSPESTHEASAEARATGPDGIIGLSNDPSPESTVPLTGAVPGAVLSPVPDAPASTSTPEDAVPFAAEADSSGRGLFPVASEEDVMVDELLRRTARRQHSTTFIAEDADVATEADDTIRTLEFEDAQNPCSSWEVVLTKRTEQDRFGLAHISAKEEFHRFRGGHQSQPGEGPEMLQVKRVAEDGLLVQWNLQHPDAKVAPGDYIAEVNGAKTVEDMQIQMRTSEVKMCIVRFPVDFHLRLRRKEDIQQIGMKFRPEVVDGMRVLRITALRESGLLEVHNKLQISKSMYHLVVCTGMSVIAVNGMDFSTDGAKQALASSHMVELHVHRLQASENPSLSARLSARHSARDSPASSGLSSNRSGSLVPGDLVLVSDSSGGLHAGMTGSHAPQRVDAALRA